MAHRINIDHWSASGMMYTPACMSRASPDTLSFPPETHDGINGSTNCAKMGETRRVAGWRPMPSPLPPKVAECEPTGAMG